MNVKLQAWVNGIGDACRELRSAKEACNRRVLPREKLAAQLDLSISTIVRWESRPDPQMLFRAQVQDFVRLYKKILKKDPRVSTFNTKEEAQKAITPQKKRLKKKSRS